MAVIKKLSQEIIGQIAAGEVVERPAAAVKELVENSIDAGATSVTVELRDGGISYLRVSDNGKGIPSEQIRMAFERHATSKLSKIEDLYNIHTLGFRGEALASIAAVAKVTCTTRTESAAFGTRVKVEAGEIVDIRQAASPVGTTIVVEDLFYNAPVRLKFLKKPAMEASMVADYMLRLILSKPEVAFRFVSQGKNVYHSMGDGSVESALFCLYGKDALKQMIKVGGHMNGVLLHGYVGAQELSRGNRQQQSFFVNGRYFRSGLLSRALEKGCEGRVMVGRFPMCALFLDMPCQQVDVNVHPNKLEVRFQNEPAVAAAVETLVSEAIHRESLGARLSAASPQAESDQPKSAQPEQGGFVVVKIGQEDETQAGETAEERMLRAASSGARGACEASANTAQPTSSDGCSSPVQRPATAQEESNRIGDESVAASPPPSAAAFSPVWQETKTPEESSAVEPLHEMPSPIVIPAVASGTQVLRETVMPTANARELLKGYADKSVQETNPAPPLAQRQDLAQKPEKTPPAKQPQTAEQITILADDREAGGQLKMVGIVFNTYWIFESQDRLLLVDQHAAHERILYDQMMARFESERISQRLLSPQLVQLTAHDMALVAELLPLLCEAGFEVEPFDESSVAVHAIPTLFGNNASAKELLLEALDQWQAGRGQVTRERMRRQVAQMACKRAIKGGDRLSDTEVEGFLREMLKSESVPNCPHGRPIVTEITRYALEKRFKRIQ